MENVKNLYRIFLFLIALALVSCSEKDAKTPNQKVASNGETDAISYELNPLDYYEFRRAYHGHDTLYGEALNTFLNRNPEMMDPYGRDSDHPLYDLLVENKIFQDGNLNLSEIDTLPKVFDYHFSEDRKFTVETRLLEDPNEIEVMSFELTFLEDTTPLLIDTLAFNFPPDVTFMKRDLNKDGREEIISIYRWYIINGDNFDVGIYTLNEQP